VNDGELRIEPVEELKQLRFNPRSMRNIWVNPGTDLVLDGFQGDSIEVELEWEQFNAAEVGIKVRRTPDGAEETAISYEPKTGVLKIDLSKSTLDPAIRYRSWCLWRPPDPAEASRRVLSQEAPLALKPGERLRLRIFLDRSMLEVFANGRQCLTQRLWPTRADAQSLALFSRGGRAMVRWLDVWDMAATNPH
jgi:beta-fructofuranosidase